MKICSLFAFALFFVFAALPLFADVTYYVDAKNGNDETGTGAEDSPKRSLAGVGALIAAQSPKENLTTVIVLPGNYGEDEGTDLSMEYAGTETDKQGVSHDYSHRHRIVVTDASSNRKVVFKARGGKEVTHIVGKKDMTTEAKWYGQGALAVGGARGSSKADYLVFDGFTFRDCYANTPTYGNVDRGGAAHNVLLVDCVVSNCVATRGGAMQGCAAHRCRLTGNRATSASNGSAANASSLYNCLIDHNVGAATLSYPNAVINCTIADNTLDASSSRAIFCQASSPHDICNTLIVRNEKGGAVNVKTAGNELHFKSIVTQGTKESYTSGATSPAVIDVDDASKCEVSNEQFADADNLDYRVTSASDAVGAGLSSYLEGAVPPSWAGYDDKVRDYAGNEIDLTKGTVQAGCLQEIYVLPPTVIIDASADDVSVEGGEIGENVIGNDPIIVKAKRAETRPFLGFAVDGEIVTHATSLNLRDLGVEPGERKTLTVVYGTVWYVKQNGGDDANIGAYPDAAKQTIKAAATNAVSGDVIKVYHGTYGESDGTMKHATRVSSKTTEIRISSRVVVNAGVTVEAVEGPEVTFIVGRADPDASAAYPTFGLGPNAVRCVFLENDATIKGFTITGGRVDKAAEGPTYDDNSDCGGILGRTRDRCLVVDCVVSNNVADEGGFGMNCRFIRSVIVGNIGVNRPASRGCAFYGCFLNDNSGGNMEHVIALDSCTVGPTCWNEAHTKEAVAIQYPTKGGSFRNSIVLAKSIWKNTQTASYLYAVTNCVFLESTREALENDGEHAALGNCTFIANVAAAGLDENYRPVPGQTIEKILDAVTPEYEAMTDASTLSSNDIAGVPRILNGVRDLGAYEGDWRPRYSGDIDRRATVTEVSPDVVEQNGKVTIPGGSKVVFTLTNTAQDVRDYALNVAVEGGVLAVRVDGESVTFESASDVRLSIPTGTHAVSVALNGEKSNLATIQSLRSQIGLLMFVR